MQSSFAHVREPEIFGLDEIVQPFGVPLSAAIISGVVWIFRGYGLQAQISIFLYISTLVSTQILMKCFFNVFKDFKFASFMTATHFLFSVIATEGVLRLQKEPTSFWLLFAERPIHEYFLSMGPLAACVAGSVLANNLSLMYIGAGLNALLSSLTPIVTAVLAVILLGKRYTKGGWFGMIVACSGGWVLAASGMSRASDNPKIMRGVLLSGIALLLRASKAVLNDRQMTDIPKDKTTQGPVRKYKPLELLVLSSPLYFGFEIVLSAYLDGFKPYIAIAARFERSPASLLSLFGFILLTCVSSCVMTMTALQTMKLLGAPAMQIIGKLNVLITTLVAAGIMHEHIDRGEIFGGCLAVLGIYIFEKANRHIFEKSNRHQPATYSKIQTEDGRLADEEQQGGSGPPQGRHRDEEEELSIGPTAASRDTKNCEAPEVMGLPYDQGPLRQATELARQCSGGRPDHS